MMNRHQPTTQVYQIAQKVSLSFTKTGETQALLSLSGPTPINDKDMARLKDILPHILKRACAPYDQLTLEAHDDYTLLAQYACIELLKTQPDLSRLNLHLWSPQGISIETNEQFLKAISTQHALQYKTVLHLPANRSTLKTNQVILGSGLKSHQLHIHHTLENASTGWRTKLRFPLKIQPTSPFFETQYHVAQSDTHIDFFGVAHMLAHDAKKIQLSGQEENVFHLFTLDSLRPKPLPPESALKTQLKIGR